MDDRIMMEYILGCIKDFVIKFNLDVNKRVEKHGLYIELENENDWLYMSYATHHPYDYPFSFGANYCKQKFINKDVLLYRTDTTAITPLWKFDDKLDTRITGVFNKDRKTVVVCCKKTAEMFAHFQAMSDDEYFNEVIPRR